MRQSSKNYIEGKIIDHIKDDNTEAYQARKRDNILIKLKPKVILIDDNESAISELDAEHLEDSVVDIQAEFDDEENYEPFGEAPVIDDANYSSTRQNLRNVD